MHATLDLEARLKKPRLNGSLSDDVHADMASHQFCLRSGGPMLWKCVIAAAAGVIAITLTVGAAPAALAENCQPYYATGHDVASSPAGPYAGIENVTIGNTTYAVPAVTYILAPLTPAGASGVLTTTTSHAIAFPSGTITTIDNVRLIPTKAAGVYKLVSHLSITGGASGQLQLRGTVNLGTLSADGTIVGTVCGIG